MHDSRYLSLLDFLLASHYIPLILAPSIARSRFQVFLDLDPLEGL
jgi:hypothetical protein